MSGALADLSAAWTGVLVREMKFLPQMSISRIERKGRDESFTAEHFAGLLQHAWQRRSLTLYSTNN